MTAIDNRSIAARVLRKGDRVLHRDYGAATVTKIRKADGAIFIKLDDDGLVGTCSAGSLSWLTPIAA